MHKQVCLNDKNKKLYCSNMNMENLIYTINMNREDLSKMTKQQLIDMLLGQKPKFPKFGIGLWTAYSVEKMFINNTQKVLF